MLKFNRLNHEFLFNFGLKIIRKRSLGSNSGLHESRKAVPPESAYQSTFNSFWDMIHTEKKDSKNFILLEDKTDSLQPLNIDTLSDVIGSVVIDSYMYQMGRRKFALLKLQDYRDFDLNAKPFMKSNHFQLKSRIIEWSKVPISIKKDDAMIKRMSQLKSQDAQSSTGSNHPMNLNDAIDYMVHTSAVTEFGSKIRFFLLNHLEELICTGIFHKFHILPFGSSVNGCGTNSSDLDLVMEPQMIDEEGCHKHMTYMSKALLTEKYQSQKMVEFVGDQLQYFIPGVSSVNRVSAARIPIIRFLSDVTGVECDLSFHAEVSVKQAEIIFDFCQYEPRLRGLISFLKIWAKSHNLIVPKGTLTFSNFMMMMLLVGFMQTRQSGPLLPPIKSTFDGMIPKKDDGEDQLSYSDLLLEFFGFIASFDFRTYGISTLNGKITVKPLPHAIYVENPLETQLNVCRNISKPQLEKLVRAAVSSYDIMMKKEDKIRLSDLCKVTSSNNNTPLVTNDRKSISIEEILYENPGDNK